MKEKEPPALILRKLVGGDIEKAHRPEELLYYPSLVSPDKYLPRPEIPFIVVSNAYADHRLHVSGYLHSITIGSA